jgi:hypothetical protein
MGEVMLFRGPLWENRWDNFLFLFPSQFLRSILRHFIPQIVPLIMSFYIGMLLLKIVIFFGLTIRLPYFWGFLDILSYTNKDSITQDEIWLTSLLGMNDFLSYMSLGFGLRYSLFIPMIFLFIPTIGNLETAGIVARVLVFNIFAAYHRYYDAIKRPVKLYSVSND